MSSINTNAGAMTALQTLKATNKNLDTTQGRISTGFRVSEAAHNAAYWSIATTMRSDNNAMSTVKDALGLGAAQVDIAYTAMDAVKDTLDTMKSKLVAASQPDIDLEKIQGEIAQLQKDLETFAESATFSGGNWLKVGTADTQQVVASFIRNDSGVSLQTIDVDTSKTALFTSDKTGALQKGFTTTTNIEKTLADVVLGTPVTADSTTPGEHSIEDLDAEEWAKGDVLKFTVTVDTDEIEVEMTYGDAAWTEDDFTAALAKAGLQGATASYTSGTLTITADENDIEITIGTPEATMQETKVNADLNVTNFDITVEDADLAGYLSDVEAALKAVTTAASELGAIKTRIGSQQDFVGKIMDAVSRGVGQLVDADMEEESTRLQALQVQQQLGIQALSIANGNTQNILSLFR